VIEFVWPLTEGEWLAWTSAFVMVIIGLWMLFMPRRWLSLMGFSPDAHFNEASAALATMRGTMGGANIGLGLAVLLLHPQPLLYLALGATFLFRSIGRMVSIVVDGANNKINWIILIIEGLMGILPLAYAFGLIA
jgi:hypothetical protein